MIGHIGRFYRAAYFDYTRRWSSPSPAPRCSIGFNLRGTVLYTTLGWRRAGAMI